MPGRAITVSFSWSMPADSVRTRFLEQYLAADPTVCIDRCPLAPVFAQGGGPRASVESLRSRLQRVVDVPVQVHAFTFRTRESIPRTLGLCSFKRRPDVWPLSYPGTFRWSVSIERKRKPMVHGESRYSLLLSLNRYTGLRKGFSNGATWSSLGPIGPRIQS